jgi:peptidoglycan/LPS O-acetylase OafA/YrhL
MQERLPQLDGVRGIAILLVIMHNTQRYPLPHLEHLFDSGWMGVDLFFVLSGFLITSILLGTKESEGYFKNFYARRCLRIWPLYYALLFLMFVLVPHVRPSYASIIFGARSSPWWAYPLFLQNFLVPIPASAAGPLGVTWSLAIEEQFYLAWPWAVRYCLSSQLRRIAVGVICLSPLARLYLSFHHVVIYSNLFCRLDGLMAGALLALTVRSQTLHPHSSIRLAWVSLLLAAPLALLTDTLNARWIVHSIAVVAAASFVYLALFSAQKWLQVVLTSRFLVYTGTISYGLYLLHKIPFDVAQTFHLGGHPLPVLLIGLVSSYALAALSWSMLEQPFLGLKRIFAPRTCGMDLGFHPENAADSAVVLDYNRGRAEDQSHIP